MTQEKTADEQWREQLYARQDHLELVRKRRWEWMRSINIDTSLQLAALAISRAEMRDLVQLAIANGVINKGGHCPSGTTVSYEGTATFIAYGIEWTATGHKTRGRWDENMWLVGADGNITIEGGGRKYVIAQIPEFVDGWWEYLVEGEEGLIGAI
jgi:hypothetical protein